eukprot:s670_g2.t1
MLPKKIFHRTNQKGLAGILQGGMIPGSAKSDRSHNYLSEKRIGDADYMSGMRSTQPIEEAAAWFHAHFMRCGSSLSKASLWTRILAWLLLHVSAVRPSHDETPMRAMRFAGPEDQDDVNRSLFENLPGKLEPIVGKKLPLWQVEAGVMGGLVLLLSLGFISSAESSVQPPDQVSSGLNKNRTCLNCMTQA